MKKNIKLAMSIFWIILGIVLVSVSAMGILNPSMYSGLGGGFIAVGIMQLIKNIRYRSNDEYREKVNIAVQDERNRYLRMMTWSWVGYIMVLVNAIALVAAYILEKGMLIQIFSTYLCGIVFLYWVVYMVLNKRY